MVLTTTSPNDVIIVACGIRVAGAGGDHCTTPTQISAGLTFYFRGSSAFSTTDNVSEWFAISAGSLTSAIVSCTATGTTKDACNTFGISGADTTAVYDSHSGLPVVTGSSSLVVPSVTGLSTENANDFLIGIYESTTGPTQTADACCTLIVAVPSGGPAHNFAGSEYEIVAALQSGTTIAFGKAATSNWVILADAIAGENSVMIVSNSSDYLPLLLLPVAMIPFIFLVKRRRRR